MTWVLREENRQVLKTQQPLGLPDRQTQTPLLYTELHTLTKVFKATHTHAGEIRLTQILILCKYSLNCHPDTHKHTFRHTHRSSRISRQAPDTQVDGGECTPRSSKHTDVNTHRHTHSSHGPPDTHRSVRNPTHLQTRSYAQGLLAYTAPRWGKGASALSPLLVTPRVGGGEGVTRAGWE